MHSCDSLVDGETVLRQKRVDFCPGDIVKIRDGSLVHHFNAIFEKDVIKSVHVARSSDCFTSLTCVFLADVDVGWEVCENYEPPTGGWSLVLLADCRVCDLVVVGHCRLEIQ